MKSWAGRSQGRKSDYWSPFPYSILPSLRMAVRQACRYDGNFENHGVFLVDAQPLVTVM